MSAFVSEEVQEHVRNVVKVAMEVKENFSGDPPDPASFGAGLSEVDRHVQQFNLTGLLPPTVRFSTFLESSLRINKSKIIGS